MTTNLNIVLAQLNPIVGDLNYNTKIILEAWSEADESCDLIVFSELIVSGYPPEDLVLKPFFMRQVQTHVEEILEASKKLFSAALLGCPWEIKGQTCNAALLIENGKIIAAQAKHHLPNYNVFDEERTFKPGPLPQPITFRGAKLGVMVCEDMWYADVPKRLKEQGAELLITINASPFENQKDDVRLKHAQDTAKNINLPLIYVNQVGGQDELVFDGGSFTLGADQKQITRSPVFQTDFHHVKYKNSNISTASDDAIAPELEDLDAIYEALKLGLHDYLKKNNFPGVLIGLSGGIDSALSTVIAVDALGKDKVHCVMMPSRFTSQDSLDDAKELAENLGVKLDNISIEEPMQAFNDNLKPLLPNDAPDTTFENIQPRSRGLILMALSNATGRMVLSTGNKSEMAVGYATLYGDMCGGFNVLKDVYKTQVYALSRWRNEKEHVIPERIITKAPTAELNENQTDQDTLPEYKELDDILTCMIEEDRGIDYIVERGHSREIVAKVWKMLDRAEYKRRQAPPGIKITSRAFGRDRRYPITNHFLNIIEKTGT